MAMNIYVCSVCGYTYDEAKGIPESGIAAGTKWEDIPHEWVCPWCGAGKSEFRLKQNEAPEKQVAVSDAVLELNSELSAYEMSILCSNLARGCEKQYLPEEASLFFELADYFKAKAEPVSGDAAELLKLVTNDLEQGLPYAQATARDQKDRGALRALTWNEKVTRIVNSLLSRYEKEGDAMLEANELYVCTVCGFVYLGNQPPELCPVCKVPSRKFEKAERS
mgnify:CR=1 FL=1